MKIYLLKNVIARRTLTLINGKLTDIVLFYSTGPLKVLYDSFTHGSLI